MHAVLTLLMAASLLSLAVRHGWAWLKEADSVSNDGLTDTERAGLARKYRSTAGSRVVTSDECETLNRIRLNRSV
jgi:hypothetical protein